MWPFDIARKRREKEQQEAKEAVERHQRWINAREEARQMRLRAEQKVVKVTPRSGKDLRSESVYSGFADITNPASPLNPIHHSTFYSSPSSSSYDSCSSSSSSYDSGSSSSSDSGSSSSSCD